MYSSFIEALKECECIYMLLIKNNLIAITIHICLSIIMFFPFLYVYNGAVTDNIILGWLKLVIYTAIPLFVYIWAGKKFLTDTHNPLINFFSVMAIAIIIVIATYLWEIIVNLPFFFVGAFISSIVLDIPGGSAEEKYIFYIISLFPSLSMWIGLRFKRSVK